MSHRVELLHRDQLGFDGQDRRIVAEIRHPRWCTTPKLGDLAQVSVPASRSAARKSRTFRTFSTPPSGNQNGPKSGNATVTIELIFGCKRVQTATRCKHPESRANTGEMRVLHPPGKQQQKAPQSLLQAICRVSCPWLGRASWPSPAYATTRQPYGRPAPESSSRLGR
jgi:hypothetical protein